MVVIAVIVVLRPRPLTSVTSATGDRVNVTMAMPKRAPPADDSKFTVTMMAWLSFVTYQLRLNAFALLLGAWTGERLES